MEIPSGFIFFSYDGDGIGRKVGRAILANDIDELRHISSLIEAGHALVQRWVKDRDGVWINGGGDEGNAAVDKRYIDEFEQIRKDYEYLVGATMSIGVGESPSEAGRALLIAKLKGKDQVVIFGKDIEKEIKAIKKRAKKGAVKSMEEYKLADAYLKKSEEDCQYCQESDGTDLDHCKYCHEADQQEGQDDCPYCLESDSAASAEDDCPYCAEQAETDDCPYCAESADGSRPPEIGDPALEQQPPIGQNAPMDTDPVIPVGNEQVPAAADAQGIDPEDNHSKEAMSAIAEAIESDGNPPSAAVNAIDDTQMVSGDSAEGNVSRPEGYAQNTPGDMGLGGTNPMDENEEDEPNFSDILSQGLDSHAAGIKKEKAIAAISQALMQFKACKQVLESVKLQSPELYQASISMLKAMIEMADLLQLNQSAPQPQLGEEQASITPEAEQNEWSNPFPTHPDHGGEPKPGHSPASAQEDDAASPQP